MKPKQESVKDKSKLLEEIEFTDEDIKEFIKETKDRKKKDK